MYSKKINIKKSILFAVLITVLGGAYYYWANYYPHIYTYNKERDMQQIMQIFQQDWHWLVSDADYSPQFTFTYMAPSEKRRYLGTLKVQVLRIHHDLIGFVAYYMKNSDLGFLLFLAVNRQYRGQKYGELLLHHGIKKLVELGAKKIQLVTRLTNIPAQTLYKRIGFYEISREPEGFVYFEYDPAKSASAEVSAHA